MAENFPNLARDIIYRFKLLKKKKKKKIEKTENKE